MMAFIDRYRWWLSVGLVTVWGSLFLTYRYLGLLEDLNEQVRQNEMPHKILSFREKYLEIRPPMTQLEAMKLLGKPVQKYPVEMGFSNMEAWMWIDKKQAITILFWPEGRMTDKWFQPMEEEPTEP
jgi:hypothetical protein